MSFWSVHDSTIVEPLRQYRWYMLFGKQREDEQVSMLQAFTFALKECTKPSYKIETSSHVLLNHTFNYPKNLVWSPIQVKMVSAFQKAGTSTANEANKTITNSGYIRPSEDQIRQISKLDSVFESITIIQVGEYGTKIEEWELTNAFINNINYGSLSYENEGFVDIEFGIVYDFAEHKTPLNNESTAAPAVTNSSPRAQVFGGEVQGGGTGRSGVLINGKSD